MHVLELNSLDAALNAALNLAENKNTDNKDMI